MTSETSEPKASEVSEKASGERSEPRASDGPSDEALRADGGEEVPLNIVGHEDREKPSERDEGASADSAGEPKQNGDGGAEQNGDGETIPGAESLLEDAPVDPEPDPEDDEVEPVELLVQLAKEGEIEPWDIDIVAVTDKFLDALDERDLRTSGRALFYASVLLRMKSDAMLDDGADEPEEDASALPPWEAPPAEDGAPAFDPVDALEAEMDRRLERKHARGSPETLDELVRDLRDAERSSWWKESRTYDTSESPQGFRRGVQELDYHTGDDFRMDDEPTEADAIGTAHQEDIEETIADVQSALDEQYAGGRTEVLYSEVADSGGSRVETFLALLFLAHRGAVTLQQDDLFGDLWVRDAATRETEEPATAD